MESTNSATESALEPVGQVTAISTSRFRFTVAQKVELLDLMKKGVARPELCRAYNIPSSTLHHICQAEAQIREVYKQNGDPNRLSVRKTPYHQLESELSKWIVAVQARNIPINGPIVQERALELAEALGADGFTASNGWLARFKKRENLDFQGRHCVVLSLRLSTPCHYVIVCPSLPYLPFFVRLVLECMRSILHRFVIVCA